MFKKVTKKRNKATINAIVEEGEDLSTSALDINSIKESINNKQKKVNQGIQFVPLKYETEKEETFGVPPEEQNELNIRKVFIPEVIIKKRVNDFLGIKREKEEKDKEEKRIGLIQMQKEIYSLPEELKGQVSTQDDYVENLIKLSTAGIIDVPLPLENKIKGEMKKVDDKVEKEVDCLKVLKKLGPSYAKGYKSDISHKQMTKLNDVFENVFINKQGRKMKFIKEREKAANKAIEDLD